MRSFASFLFLFALSLYAMNLDSLPFWEDSLIQKEEKIVVEENDSEQTLETSGSKTISVIVGDGGTEVNQELRLFMHGFATDGVYIEALLSDVGRSPGDQNTATLKEVDEVYFKVNSEYADLQLGDLTFELNNSGLSGIHRTTLGVMGSLKTEHSTISGTYGVDEVKHYSVSFPGVDGQQKGYVVGEVFSYLSLVKESESVYYNGVKLKRGKDYEINYAGGVLDFKNNILPGADDEILVEYDAYNSGYASTFLAAEGSYRSKHIWLDVSGFQLEDDLDRLKRSTLDSSDYAILKADKGDSVLRNDSSVILQRPASTEKASARIRTSFNDFFVDLETAFYKKDSNTISSEINGSQGLAFRYHIQSDSTGQLKHFPLMVGFSGNYSESTYQINEYAGTERDWNAYELKEYWDLDTARLGSGLRHEELYFRYRFFENIFGKTSFGYRQSTADSSWNSLRVESHLERLTESALLRATFRHVDAFDSLKINRNEGTLQGNILSGFFRPFANINYAYWNKDADSLKNISRRFKEEIGLALVSENWQLEESFAKKLYQTKTQNSDFQDSSKQFIWTEKATFQFQKFSLEHLFQYKKSDTWIDGTSDAYLSENTAKLKTEEYGIEGNIHYNFGLTKEQPYIAIYKAVAKGTGDVMYDSITGVFIEGVDNGDFVYEGMGRTDSLSAILAFNTNAELYFSITPGTLFHINHGFLKDLTLGLDFRSEAYDTTGKRVFLPPFTPKMVRKLTSGLYYAEGDIGLFPADFLTIHYYPGTEYEKKNLSQNYFQKKYWHKLHTNLKFSELLFLETEGFFENTELQAISNFNYDIYQLQFLVRKDLQNGFFIEPDMTYRYGKGQETDETFDAHLKEAALKFGYLKETKIDTYLKFSFTHLKSSLDYLPYQFMSGYDSGITYRLEAFAEIYLSSFLSMNTRYILRFSNNEKDVFQKWSMEARAYL